MGRAKSRSVLSQSIAEILGTAEPANSTPTRPGALRRSLIYSSMALLVINPAQVNAVGLGEITVKSQLGQPLDATVPITLGPGESLPQNCVAPTRGNSGIGAPNNMRVSTPAATQPGTYNLRVTTTNALHEPMYEISLLVDCPGTPVLLRQYVLMLNLPGMDLAAINQPEIGNPASSPTVIRGDTLAMPLTATPAPSRQTLPPQRATTPATNLRASQTLQQSHEAIQAGGTYRVRRGDSLSVIAARIDGRAPDTTWSVANLIFVTNPQAFIRNNPDLIKLGSLINIPGVAELAEFQGGRSPITTVAALKQLTAQPENFSEPQPAPTPAPIPAPVAALNPGLAAANRSDAFVSEPESKQPDVTPFLNTGNNDSARGVETSAESDGDTVLTTPFLDEQPVPVVTEDTTGPATDIEAQPVPVVTTTTVSEPSAPTNPFLAILIGMLLGLAVSLVMFRRKFLAAINGLLARRQRPADIEPVQDYVPPVSSNDEYGTEVSSAFDSMTIEPTPQPQPAVIDLLAESESLPIGNPAENTYIVESQDMDSTAEVKAAVLAEIEAKGFDENTLKNIGEPQASPDDELLAQLFADNTSMIDESDADIFDPTAQLPAGQPDLLLDETVELPGDLDETFDMSPTIAIDDTVQQVNPDELFPAGEDEAGDFFDAAPTTKITNETAYESELDALPMDNETDLSEALNEAMSLLERDFEDEFTESQILERSQIAKSLDKAEAEDKEDATIQERKVGG